MNGFLKILGTLMMVMTIFFTTKAQQQDPVVASVDQDTIYSPTVIYSPMPKSYEIADITVQGVSHVDDYHIIAFSGLSVGEKLEIPGNEISNAVKRFYRQGIYSKVQILVTKTVGDKAWLTIVLRQHPRMSEMRFNNISSGDKKDIIERLGMVPGHQVTPNIIKRAEQIIQNFYAAKGFKNAQVHITEHPDLSKENQVILDVAVNKNSKVKVHKIYVEGNEILSDNKVKRAMKKTNENGNILNLFKQKKFVEQDFKDDLHRIISKYNELGYRDAQITFDSVVPYSKDRVDVHIGVDEAAKILHQRYQMGRKHRVRNRRFECLVGHSSRRCLQPKAVAKTYIGR